MHIQKRKNLFITFLIITVLTVLVWGVSKYIQPILPPQVNADLVLVLASLVGVITILTGIPDIFERITKFISGEDKKGIFTEKQNRHNREVMLIRVWDAWIEGVLKKSLYNEVRMQLGLELHPEAVENPWDSILQIPEQAPISIPANKKMLDVFNECGKSIVIIGEPGSGKTTELLELANQAIEWAKNNSEQPIPVVFNLSTWIPTLTLKEWLVNEFWERYRISPKLGSCWVENNELMILLDGLDEVKNEFRNQCVQAINELIKQKTVPIAICCRRSEFEDLDTRINVHGAILIQPLSSKQSMKYLKKVGSKLVDIYKIIKTNSDAESLNFIHTPLFLSILILVHRNASDEDIELLVKSENYQRHLFDSYIEQMFNRRGIPTYSIEQTKRWLAWLASRMIENGLSVFYIENIQLNWLESNNKLSMLNYFLLLLGLLFSG